MAQRLSDIQRQSIGPIRLSDVGGPSKKRLIDVEPARDIKPMRFGKQLINTFSRSAKEIFLGIGGEKVGSFIMAAALNKKLKAKGIKPPSLLETRKRIQTAMREQLKEYVPEFETAPAITVGEKATDVAAGITGFVTELAVLKKTIPGLSGAKLWEVQNLASGGTPGVGAATYGVFNLPGKAIKGASITAKAGRLGAESVLMGGMSAAQQKIQTGEINATDVLVSAGIPLGMRAAGGAKGVLSRALKAKNPKAIAAINQTLYGKSKQMELADQTLLKWAPTAKAISKEIKDPAIQALRKRQVGRGSAILRRSLSQGTPAWQAIEKSVGGYKGGANVPDITPPPLTNAQWEGYAQKILKVVSGQFKITDTQKALKQLRLGKIPTPRQFELLEPLFGPKTTETLFNDLVKKRQFSGWDAPALAVQGLKSIFGLDLQVSRQAGTLKWRHPILYKKAQYANIRGYANKAWADKAMADLMQSPGYTESAKHLNYIGSKGYSSRRLEYFKMGFTELLANAKFKNTVVNKTLGGPLRAYGKFLQASEHGATVGINQMMKGLWDKGMKDLAQIPNLTKAERQAWIVNRAKTINTNMKILRTTHIKDKDIRRKVDMLQNAANYILFSPSVTVSKPLTIKALFANKGSRGYQAQVLASNIGGIMLTTAIPAVIAQHQLRQKPDEEPEISGELNPLSSSWGKIRIKDEVFDFSGGDAPFYRFLARVGVSAYLTGQETITGKRQTTVAGKTVAPIGETFLRYGESRETALLGLAKTLATGKDFVGNPIPQHTAMVKALTPEIITATIEAGLADGTWAALATGVATANSVGVSTYPVKAANTRANFRNIIAQKAHGQRWDNLSLKEQRRLLAKNRKQFDAFSQLIKTERVEKPFSPERIIEEERQSAKRITKMLTKANQTKITGVSVAAGRRPKNFYLNDTRYQKYQESIAKHLDERLSRTNLEGRSDKVRIKIVEVAIKLAKDKAFRDIRRETR